MAEKIMCETIEIMKLYPTLRADTNRHSDMIQCKQSVTG